MSFNNTKRKLCVAGCSISDYTRVDRTYGEILSENLGFEYLHEGSGCGSNARIWRRITNHILAGTLTENDIIIIQYTEPVRTEFWSVYPMPSYKHEGPSEEPSHNGGRILKWKMGSYTWQHYEIEKNFHRAYEKYFVNDKFSRENFTVNNFNFQHMLSNLKMKVIFNMTKRIGQFEDEIILDCYKPLIYRDITAAVKEYDLAENDQCHMNQAGHEITAENLKNHILNLNLI